MSHSEEEGNYWPGYVDALTSMVQVLAFVMMMLAMAVFALSQKVSKSAIESIAQAVNAEVKPNASVTELTQAVMDKIKSRKSPEPGDKQGETASEAEKSEAIPDPRPSPADDRNSQERKAIIVRSEQTNISRAPPKGAPGDPVMTLTFAQRGFTIDKDQELSLGKFVDENRAAASAGVVTVNAYAYSGEGALSEARRVAYYRAMTTRKQLVDAKLLPDNVRINVTDTTDKNKSSIAEIIVSKNGGAH